MADKILLEIITPERQVVQSLVDEVTAPGVEGYFGVLPGHTPFLTTLKIGEIAYKTDNITHYLAVCWGYAEVGPDRVIVLAETAEAAEEIDIDRAERARKRAEERLQQKAEDIDFDRARIALERALIRLQVASKKAAGSE
jgi:F-type H+-transporting ATPase subunit epsilon